MGVYKRTTGLVLIIVIAIAPIGCDSSTDTGGGASMDEMAAAVSAQKAAEQAQPATATTTNQAPAEAERKVAERAGVQPGGYYTAIVGARRHVLNKVDDLAWIQGVQHFKAEQGRLPKDHAEFMSKIIEPLGINLGYKQENEEFLYDPSAGDWGEVYVVEKLDQPAQ